jgi:hypothetical protein
MSFDNVMTVVNKGLKRNQMQCAIWDHDEVS